MFELRKLINKLLGKDVNVKQEEEKEEIPKEELPKEEKKSIPLDIKLETMNFSELRKGNGFVLPEVTADEKHRLVEMSKIFWGDNDQILQESRGHLAQDRYFGILRLYEYLCAWKGYKPDFDDIYVSNGCLKYHYDTENSGSICYDGGCYSDETIYYYIYLVRIPIYELEYRYKMYKSNNIYKRDTNYIPKRFSYSGELTGDDCKAYYTEAGIWLSQPFGLKDGIWIYE